MKYDFGAEILAQANSRTETEYRKDGRIESVKRGVNSTDYIAWKEDKEEQKIDKVENFAQKIT